jgi:hypothetical protein
MADYFKIDRQFGLEILPSTLIFMPSDHGQLDRGDYFLSTTDLKIDFFTAEFTQVYHTCTYVNAYLHVDFF